MTTDAQRSSGRLVLYAVVGLGVLALVLVTIVRAHRLPFVSGGVEYRAEFSDASGLAVGEEVRVAGIKVGQVDAIDLHDGKVLVSFTVDGLELGRRTTAGIEIKSLLGQHFLSVTPDGPGSLAHGATIPLARTSTPLNIVPAVAGLTERAGALDVDQVAHAFDALASTLDASRPELGATLRGLSRISRTVSSRDEAIQTLLRRTADVSGTVAARDDDLGELIKDSADVLATLDSRRAVINRIIDGTQALSTELRGLVADQRTTLGPTLDSLNRVLEVLRANRKNLDETIKLGELYGREFVAVGGSGQWFDATVKIPQGFALCTTDGLPSGVGTLLGSALSQVNQSVNGSSRPCLPLGPAAANP